MYNLKDASNFKELFLYFGREHQFINRPEFETTLASSLKHFLYENEIDIFIVTSPFENQMLPYKREWFLGTKIAVIVYDIIPYLFQKQYFGDINVNGRWYLERLKLLKEADLCLAISDSAADDLVKHVGISSEKVHTIWGAVDKKFKKMDISEIEMDDLKRKYKIDSEIIMCTGGDDQRKNLESLIEAYAKMPQELIAQYQLVIICKMSVESRTHYQSFIKSNGVYGRVIITGFVSDEELVMFYNCAKLLAFPSIYEGFGLPIVEAFACGTPVLTSYNSSLGQIAGDAAILVDPFEVESISSGLIRALTEMDLEELVLKGNKRLEMFQWDKVANYTLDALKTLDIIADTKCKGKIAMFTPLPPILSGISDYSYDIILELSRYTDIDIFIDSGYEVDCTLPDNVKCYEHTLFSKYAPNYDEIIYQVGNSLFHVYMWAYIKKYPGVVVLHDGNLHSSVYAAINRQSDYGTYENILIEDYPEKNTVNYINQLLSQQIEPAISSHWVNGFIVNHAKKIIVHNNYLMKKLLSKRLALDVECIRLYAKFRIPDDFKADRYERGYTNDDIIVGIFGLVSYPKKVKQCLEAFKIVSEEEPHLRMIIVGSGSDSEQYIRECEIYIRENGLQERVRFTGYVDENLMEIYINISDICLNLRYMYKGESSATLAHILAQGKCAVVNNIGDFAELPDDACYKLPYYEEPQGEHEINEIAEALRDLLNPELRSRIGRNAKLYIKEEREIKKISAQYYECICRPQYTTITEQNIHQIISECINYKDEEMDDLADTILFSKGFGMVEQNRKG